MWGLVLLVGAGCLVLIVGWMLPVKHQATVTTTVAGTPQEAYAAVAAVTGWPDWLDGTKNVEMLEAVDGRTRFRQHSTDGPLVLEIVEAQPGLRFVTRIADPGQPFGGSWTFEFSADATGTRVTITEHGEVYNPLFRFVSRFVFGHDRTIRNFLASLQRYSETPRYRT